MSSFLTSFLRVAELARRTLVAAAIVVLAWVVGATAWGVGCDRPPRAEQKPRAIEPGPAPLLSPDDRRDVAELSRRSLQLPVEGITKDRLVPTFDQMRGDHVHKALDILATRGTPVLAVEDGTIAKLFTSKQGGLTIYQFDPTGRYAYYYAHLDGYLKGLSQGQAVRRAQVIGYVGSTGNADARAPHLHFAIFKLGPERRWWQGDAIDPYEVFTTALYETQ